MVEHNPAGGQRLVQASVLGTVLSYAESRMRPVGMTLTALLMCAFSQASLAQDVPEWLRMRVEQLRDPSLLTLTAG